MGGLRYPQRYRVSWSLQHKPKSEIPEPAASSLCALLECAVMRKDHCIFRALADVGIHSEAVATILSHILSAKVLVP